MREKFSEEFKPPTKKQIFDDSLVSVINCISKCELDDSYFETKFNMKKDDNDMKKHFEKNNSELETHHNGEDFEES